MDRARSNKLRARPPTARGASSSANGSRTWALTGRATEIVRAGWTGAVELERVGILSSIIMTVNRTNSLIQNNADYSKLPRMLFKRYNMRPHGNLKIVSGGIIRGLGTTPVNLA